MRSHKHLFVIKYTHLFMRKKKINKKFEPKQNKSRAKYKLPIETGNLIDYVNDVPSNVPLSSSRAIELGNPFAPAPDLTSDERETQFVANSRELFEECFFAFSEKYKNELLAEKKEHLLKTNPGNSERRIYHRVIAMALRRYDDIVAKREILIDIANYFAALRKGGYFSESDDAIQTGDGKYLKLPGIYVPLSRSGTIGKVDTGLAAAFHDVDLDRIRICEICSHFFWAAYKNSFTCSEPCLNALRQRRHREKNKEAINEKRRANYDRNKKLKQLKERKNGTL